MMQLIPDFAAKYPRFWSVQLGTIAAILSAIELSLPHFEMVLPQPYFGYASLVFMVLTLVARALAQPELHKPQ